MAEIGYPKDHRFIEEVAAEMDIWSAKTVARDAVRVWRKSPLGIKVRYGTGLYTLAEVQRRGTMVRIVGPWEMMGRWVSAELVKPA